ncbi:MAG: hypothetical protein GC178_06320 [Flavobacteriales bacterium]|nr:hypothetical protein [Flavobacteriales bacterium]
MEVGLGMIYRVALLIVLLVQSFLLQAQKAEFESISYLNKDGKSYTSYTNVNSDFPETYRYLEKGKSPLQYFLYVNPNDYIREPLENEFFDRLRFLSGANSIILNDTLTSKELTIDDNGVYTVRTDDKKNVDGHYGFFWEGRSLGFSHIALVWVLPDNFEILSYSCNRNGKWVERENSLSFFGKDVNDLVFEIKYRKKSSTPSTYLNRSVDVKKSINTSAENVELHLRDNSTEDGDIISVSLNGEWIVKGLRVTKAGATLNAKLSPGNNYLIMHAENEGSIPPNTAAIKISAEGLDEEIILSSSPNTSQAIELIRK